MTGGAKIRAAFVRRMPQAVFLSPARKTACAFSPAMVRIHFNGQAFQFEVKPSSRVVFQRVSQ